MADAIDEEESEVSSSECQCTMTQSRLNNLLVLYIHSTETNDLDLHNIAKEFASVNSRRCIYFGKF